MCCTPKFLSHGCVWPYCLPPPSWLVYLEQMTSWELGAAGSSFRRLLDRSRVRRLIRPQGTTEGRDVRLLEDRSRWVVRDRMSMNQSSSNQGSCRPLQHTLTACPQTDTNHRSTWRCCVCGVCVMSQDPRSPPLLYCQASPPPSAWGGVGWSQGGPSECRRRSLLHSGAGRGRSPRYLQHRRTTLSVVRRYGYTCLCLCTVTMATSL